MNDTPKHKTMDEQTQHIAQRLEQVGYEALWANGKGGGFWINGLGYRSLKECADLVAMMIVIKAVYVNFYDETEIELIHHFATQRIISSLWTLEYVITDADNPTMKIIKYGRNDKHWILADEMRLPSCNLIESDGRIITEVVINPGPNHIVYRVENPQHIFSYR